MTDYNVVLGEAEAKKVCERVVGCYNEASSKWAPMIGRHQRIRWLVEGHWDRVFPDDVTEMDLPKVSNLFRVTIEDVGRMFAETTPSERTFTPKDDETSVAANERRERVLNAYTQGSREFEKPRQEYRGMDMVAAGFTAIKVWPDFKQQPNMRFPKFKRLDPLNVLPEVNWSPDEPSDNVIVHYKDTLNRLEGEFPEQTQRILQQITEWGVANARGLGYDMTKMLEQRKKAPELRIIDWYSSKEIIRVGVYSFEGRSCSELLLYRANDTHLCPVQLAYRPSWGAEPIGQLDDVRGTVQAKNRAFTMLLDYFIDMVYGGKLVWNVKNPKDRGPNTVYYALGPDGKMDPITPGSPSFAAFNLLEQMETETRSGAVSPAAREGDVNLNKATASFLTGAQGQLRSVVTSLHGNYASTKQLCNTIAFEQDKAWCQAPGKEITGIARGRRFADSYNPVDDIGKNVSNVVRHGFSSGLDMPTATVLLQNKLAQGAISLESVLEADPTIEDVQGEMNRIHAGHITDSFIAGFEQLPVGIRAQLLVAIKAGKSIEDIAQMSTDLQQAQVAQNPLAAVSAAGGGPGAPVLGEPTGVPGTQGSQPPALPPTALLRAGTRGSGYSVTTRS